MTHRTPVLISDDPVAAHIAGARGWKVLKRDGQLLRFAGLDPAQTLALPPLPFSVHDGSLDAATVGGWDNLLNWLQKHIHEPMPVVAPDEWAAELALWAAASRGWPFGVWIDGAPPLHTPTAAACMLASEGLFAPKPEALTDLANRWKEPFSELPATPLIDVDEKPTPREELRDLGVTRVLVVSHHDEPTLPATPGLAVDLVTAVRRPGAGERTHYVPDLGAPGLTNSPGPLPAWAAIALAGDRERPVAASDHIGGYWRWQLEKYFDARADHYDVVYLTGEQYVAADFALYAKRRWYARIIDGTTATQRYSSEAEQEQVGYDSAGWAMQVDAVLGGEESPEEIAALAFSLGEHVFPTR
ncbi:hypothetical protein [Tessaracoccus sp. ZS01]|uniref:hypothetical protein n=1 Tax=Tessaracoccus sp. ZS01 TaxID=1906324 RepID=UPI00096D72C0|nr:hypothetical protein [Tessaracoccus sp. ZS01]MCG6567637.1 hypothetical protein [Tessaracoccus sp. ZS01]OMG55712.1 hypothetical protein BJN44_08385 [Tessaracoccus sp. ZS01]